MKKILLPLALFLPFAACGDEEEMMGPCTTDADCTGLNPVCDFRTGECVLGCDMPADCSGEFPVCNDDGANTMAPAVCICEPGSCSAGQACLPNGDCGVPTDCGTPGAISQPPCQTGEVCLPNGMCEAACDNPVDCIPNMQVCDTSTTASSTFNSCVEPGAVNADCPQAMGYMRDAGGPIITDVQFTGAMMDPNCTGDALVQTFAMEMFTFSTSGPNMNGIPARPYQDGIQQITNGMGGLTFSQPTITQTSTGTAAGFTVEFTLCLSTQQMMQGLAVGFVDADSNRSNPYCFVAQ
jgi:hypothetical protein